MLPKVKDFIMNNKKLVIIAVGVLLALVLFILLYKSLFYSSSEKANYGVRLRDIKENEFTLDDKKEVEEKISDLDGVDKTTINIKGRLIKVFVTFEENTKNEDIKEKLNETLSYFSEKVKNYYDVQFYACVPKDGEEVHPVIGYKHKASEEITFDEL